MLFQAVENKIFEGMTPKQIHYVKPIPYQESQGLTREIYVQMQRDLQFVPPIALHAPSLPLLGAVWSMGRETFVAGSVRRAEKEAVSAAVAKINTCSFCVDAHSLFLHGTADHDVVKALVHDDNAHIQDAHMRALVEWALANRTPEAPIIQSPPFSAEEAPEIIGTAVAFHYTNRMVNIFLDDSLVPLPSAFAGLGGIANRVVGIASGRRMANLTPTPGESLKFVPDAPLPDDMAWAAGSPTVAKAAAGMAHVIEGVGRSALSDAVRQLVWTHIQAWRGEDPGLSRRWVEEAIADLVEGDKPAGRLTLLTALASYQVDEGVINAFRWQQPDDETLIGATAWASFTAARRIGAWLHVGQPATVSV
ncbi:hypothetical protein KFU94_12405 [Chloroflexi bacterium TSY]|nr:hypothetical protein [Chloroflexi bacterium TSY]